MPDQDHITPEEAAELLGISVQSSAPQVERAYAEKLEGLEKKVAQAATAALKNKYRLAVDRLKLARDVLSKADDGGDLPSLEVTHHEPSAPAAAATPAPAPAPDPAPAVKAEPAAAPAAASKATPSAPGKKSPLMKIVAGVVALGVVGGGAVMLLKPPATAVYAGDYRKRIAFDTTIFDYSVSVAKDGKITGFNQVADKSDPPITITGALDAAGVITASGSDKSVFGGTVKGDVMELEEKFPSKKSVFYTLGKGTELPAAAPQAKFAGDYQERSLKKGDTFYSYDMKVSESGALTGTATDESDGKGWTITGRVGTKGKITATGPGTRVTQYSGTVEGDVMHLTEKFTGVGDPHTYDLPKGTKPKAAIRPKSAPVAATTPSRSAITTPAPASRPAASSFAGDYRRRITFPTTVFDYSITVAADGTLTGTNVKADHSTEPSAITGKVDAQGNIQATDKFKSVFTGSITGDELKLKETLADGKSVNYSLGKGVSLPKDYPQAAFEGIYQNSSLQDSQKRTLVYTLSLGARGEVSGSFSPVGSEEHTEINGRVSVVGKVAAKAEDKPGGGQSYEGKVENGILTLEMTQKGGSKITMEFKKRK